MRRWQLKKNGLAVEAEFNSAGRHYLEALRKSKREFFKGGRIVDILQLGDMPTRKVYEIGGDILAGEPTTLVKRHNQH